MVYKSLTQERLLESLKVISSFTIPCCTISCLLSFQEILLINKSFIGWFILILVCVIITLILYLFINSCIDDILLAPIMKSNDSEDDDDEDDDSDGLDAHGNKKNKCVYIPYCKWITDYFSSYNSFSKTYSHIALFKNNVENMRSIKRSIDHYNINLLEARAGLIMSLQSLLLISHVTSEPYNNASTELEVISQLNPLHDTIEGLYMNEIEEEEEDDDDDNDNNNDEEINIKNLKNDDTNNMIVRGDIALNELENSLKKYRIMHSDYSEVYALAAFDRMWGIDMRSVVPPHVLTSKQRHHFIERYNYDVKCIQQKILYYSKNTNNITGLKIGIDMMCDWCIDYIGRYNNDALLMKNYLSEKYFIKSFSQYYKFFILLNKVFPTY